MYHCPRCDQALVEKLEGEGLCWTCDYCGGRAMGVVVLRRRIGEKRMATIWKEVFKPNGGDGCMCPMCSKRMTMATVDVDGREMAFDLCLPCELIWLDAGEYEAIPLAPPKPHVLGEIDWPNIPIELREKLAMMKVDEIAEKAQAQDNSPDMTWKTAPSLLGLPVEMDPDVLTSTPWATYALSAIIVAISGAAFFRLQPTIDAYGLIPTEAGRSYGLTWLTSFFLHGSPWHLIGNIYFLLLFGRAVENSIGPWRWLTVIFTAAFFGDLLHVLGNLHSALPAIGASGGISGIITYYALRFPEARLGMFFRLGFILLRWIVFPAWVALVLWVLLQFFTVWEEQMGLSNVAALAHLGGAAIGAAFWGLWRNLNRPELAMTNRNPINVKIQ